MPQSAEALATKLARHERRLAALERSSQLTHSTVSIAGADVPLPEALSAGVAAKETADTLQVDLATTQQTLDETGAVLDGRLSTAEMDLSAATVRLDSAEADLVDAFGRLDGVETTATQAQDVADAAAAQAAQAVLDAQAAHEAAEAAEATAGSVSGVAADAQAAADAAATQASDALAQAQAAGSDATAAQTAATAAQTAADEAKAQAATANTAAATADAAAAQAAADAAQALADAATAQSAADTAKSTADAARTAAQSAQGAADTANTAAATAKSTADDAASAAAAASGLAGSKADVLVQSTTPATAMQKVTTLWIDTTSGKNTPKRWVSPSWVAVTDKAATDAAAAAATAKSAADAAASAAAAAQSTADDAHTLAGTADSNAQAAITSAGQAQTTANNAATSAANVSKNLFSTAVPSGTAPYGSTWFQVDGTGQVIGQWQQTAAGIASTWTSRPVTSSIIANLDVGKLTAGTANLITATAQKIAAGTAAFQTVDVKNLFVTTGATMATAVIDKLWADVVQAKALTGATITGATIQSSATTGGVKFTSAGIFGYTSTGSQKFKLDATTGDVTLSGTLAANGATITGNVNVTGTLNGGTLVGATIKSASTGQRVEVTALSTDFYNSSNVLAGRVSGKVVANYPYTYIESGTAWLQVGGNREAADYASVSSDSANFDTLKVGSINGVSQSDTGWVPMTFASDYTTQGGTAPAFRKIGNTVYTRGLVDKISGQFAANVTYVIGSIPTVFCATEWLYLPTGGDIAAAQLQILDTGSVRVRAFAATNWISVAAPPYLLG